MGNQVGRGDPVVEMALRVHEQSLSDLPMVASAGRILKDMLPAMETCLSKEVRRDYGDLPTVGVVAPAIAVAAGQMVGGFLAASGLQTSDLVDDLLKGLTDAFEVGLKVAMGVGTMEEEG